MSEKQIPEVIERAENLNKGVYALERRKVLRRWPLYPI